MLVAPTETFYGVVASALDGVACAKVVACKGRPPAKPFPLVVADAAQAHAVAHVSAGMAALMAQFWPGPLTLVLPARTPEAWPQATCSADGALALRVPGHGWLRALAAAHGGPLTATSANVAGAPAVTTLAEVRLHPTQGLLGIDGGPTPGSAPSTLVAERAGALVVLRVGATPGPAVAAAWAATKLV